MMGFQNPLLGLQAYQELLEAAEKGRGPLLVTGVPDAGKGFFVSAFTDKPWKLLVTFDETRAKELCDDCRAFSDQVWLYPAKDLLFASADIRSNEVARERISVRRRMAEESGGIVITTPDGLMDCLEEPDRFREERLFISEEGQLDLQETAKRLADFGYERCQEVDGPGQFSVRGGILDVFPVTESLPVRIELWDEDIDSIRSFDPDTQRSIDRLTEVTVYPAEERSLGGRASFLRYFDPAKSLIFLDEPPRLKERAEAAEREYREAMEGRAGGKTDLPDTPEIISAEELFSDLKNPISVCISGLDLRLPEFDIQVRGALGGKSAASYPGSFELLIGDLKRYQREQWQVVLLTPSRTRAARLAESFREYELSAWCPRDPGESTGTGAVDAGAARVGAGSGAVNAGAARVGAGESAAEAGIPLVKGAILVMHGALHRGFEFPLLRFAVLSETDLFGSRRAGKKRQRRQFSGGSAISSLSEVSVGDYVIHEEYGLGIYRGIDQIETDGVLRDYIKIEYRGGDNCYVPATRLDVIQKYAAGDVPAPRLNRLGGPDWNRTRAKVKGAVAEIAKELVQLYAARLNHTRTPYGPDTVWQKEFEELFPYEETEDQKRAIEDVKADMEKGRVMDRLICGDVGYGKTEIALRAAFKAVQEGEQVILLCPTTILAQQHYNTFAQRMKDFPVRVDLLCRFRSAAEQRKTFADFTRGTVDVIIGTHRVLSKALKPKKLGLVIVDEEQRFGVTHKERLKELKKDVNVLTLTATPIPRTLHMSLAGIRQLSVLEEPPQDRQPIQTYVMEYSEEIVREAIRRELSRGGQVYYVFNRVNRIREVTDRLKALLPDAEIAFAHGQMQERELESIMMDFMNGDIQVLVSTTIIETGLDIPNVNTIIVQDAERLGLSQLYQLRGRVGRSSRTSYAFLLYRREQLLTEEAEKRLKAIREFTELGSGIRIAMRDLEIRGAGNVLGAEQHGHMQAVGYDLYCKLLGQAVRQLTGQEEEEPQEEEFQTTVDTAADAFIPTEYIKSEEQKLDIYRRIALVETEEDELNMQDELLDRFGEIPKPVRNLLLIARIRYAAHRAEVTEVNAGKEEAVLLMKKDARLDTERLPELISAYRGKLLVRPGETVRLVFRGSPKAVDGSVLLIPLLKLCEALSALRLPAGGRKAEKQGNLAGE